MSNIYENPLVTRYASRQMAELFGSRHRILTWRRIWLALAEAEAELGLPISNKQLAQLRRMLADPASEDTKTLLLCYSIQLIS